MHKPVAGQHYYGAGGGGGLPACDAVILLMLSWGSSLIDPVLLERKGGGAVQQSLWFPVLLQSSSHVFDWNWPKQLGMNVCICDANVKDQGSC